VWDVDNVLWERENVFFQEGSTWGGGLDEVSNEAGQGEEPWGNVQVGGEHAEEDQGALQHIRHHAGRGGIQLSREEQGLCPAGKGRFFWFCGRIHAEKSAKDRSAVQTKLWYTTDTKYRVHIQGAILHLSNLIN